VSRREIRDALKGAASGNVLDRAIGAVAPVWAAKRQKARMFMALAGGYTGARASRRQTSEWSYTKGNDADGDTLLDLPTLRDRSRDLVRNEPLATGAIGGTVTSVVGTGLALQSRIDRDVLGLSEEQAEAWQKKTESEYRLWAESTACDATRTQDIYGLQALAFRAALESGDVFATTPMREVRGQPYKLCLQLIEADQCSNENNRADSNECAGGVKLDAFRAPVGYWFQDGHPGALRGSRKWTYYEAFGSRTGRRQIIHLYDKLRPGQTRGVPWLAPVIETLKMLGRYTEAELMAAVIAGMFTVFVESARGGLDPADSSGIGEETGAQASDNSVKMGVGAIVDLNPGEKISTANPGRPNPAFEGFVMALSRFVGIALELPVEVLIKHFSSSYSASRAALLEAWKFYNKRRAWLAQMFCNPVYELWMDEAVATGRIAAPGYFDDPLMRRAYLGAEWVGDGPISVDPVKDITAAKLRIDACMSTLQKESSKFDGGDWKDNITQRGRERKAIEAAGAASAEVQPAPANSTDNNSSSGSDQEDPSKRSKTT
jgi:lambda family phage portal protein